MLGGNVPTNNSKAMQITTPTLNLNQDLEEAKNYLDSQASSIADQDLSFEEPPLQNAFETNDNKKHPKPLKTPKSKRIAKNNN